MGEAHQFFQPKGTSPALDRVDRAKSRIDRLAIAVPERQRGDIGFKVSQQFLAF